jgi:hypothetical protein
LRAGNTKQIHIHSNYGEEKRVFVVVAADAVAVAAAFKKNY